MALPPISGPQGSWSYPQLHGTFCTLQSFPAHTVVLNAVSFLQRILSAIEGDGLAPVPRPHSSWS